MSHKDQETPVHPGDYAPVVMPDWKVFQKVDNIVNKTYLSELEVYPVLPCPESLEKRAVGDSVCFFPVSKFVFDKEESIYQKLTSVYASAASAGVNVAMLIKSTPKSGVEIYLGACDEDNRENAAMPKTELLYKSFIGNFPGCRSEKGGVVLSTSDTESIVNRCFSANYKAVASVSAIASLRGQQRDEKNNAFYQGIEKSIEAMQDSDYAILILARALSAEELKAMREELEMLHTQLNPFAKSSFSVNSTNSEGTSKTLSDALTKTMTETKSHTLSIGTSESVSKSENEFQSNSWSIGASMGTGSNLPFSFSISPGYSKSKGKGKGTTATHGDTKNESDTNSLSEGQSTTVTTADGKTVTVTQGHSIQLSYENKQISEILASIDQQLKRLKTGAGLGMFAAATYFLASTALEVRTGASAYKAVISGDNTHLESASINVWQDEEYTQVVPYLRQLCHPVLAMGDYPTSTTPAAIISSPELAIQMSLPKSSLINVPVRESVSFGRSIIAVDSGAGKRRHFQLGNIYHLGCRESTGADLDLDSLTMHTFITGTTGSGKSNTVYCMLDGLTRARKDVHFLIIEPAKGEYKAVFGQRGDVHVYGTNPDVTKILRINPFRFCPGIHVLEHIDRLLSIFNVCWPMEAAMPAVLKQALERAYASAGWDLRRSVNSASTRLFPSFVDVMHEVEQIMDESAYSSDNKGDYKGALCTRLNELATGLNSMIFVPDDLSDAQLFDENVIVDLSRIGSPETKALLMGLLVIRLQEYRQSTQTAPNAKLRHITVLEEAHHLLKRTSTQQSMDSANLVGKSVEMLSNAFAEMRSCGEGFIIADQSPEQMDMSVLRNTNTKIVMRLPTQEDRKAVGKSIGLNDVQIAELAKLPTGVGAVYQNDWMDAVLVKMPYFENSDNSWKNDPEDEAHVLVDADVESLLDALMHKDGIDIMVDQLKGSRIDAVACMRLPTQVKRQLIHYINNTDQDKVDQISRIAFELFNMREAMVQASTESLSAWREDMLELLEPSLEGYDEWDKDTLLLLLSHEYAIRNPLFKQIYIELSAHIPK